MTSSSVTQHIDGAIAEIRIDDGGVAVLDAVASAAVALAEDPSVHVLLLSGAPGGLATIQVDGADAVTAIERMPQPVIACIEGSVDGVGLALALACDLRIASEDAMFALTDVAAGSLPPFGATQRLQRLIGHSQATAMILLGEHIDADAAYECGLVNEVVAAGTAGDRAHDIAMRIAAQGPIAVRYAKEAIRQGLDMPLEQALRYETDLTIILQSTGDRAEGVRAFLEKRQPKFKGA